MLDLFGLLAVISAFFVVAASPGPATLAVATIAMGAGRSNGVRFGAGLGVGLAFWGLVAATGLGAILQASTVALSILKVFGGAYLMWLAYASLRSARQVNTRALTSRLDGEWFKRGILLNLSNPKAIVAWMATLSLGVSTDNGLAQVVTATGLCVALGFLIYASYALIFSTNGAMNAYARLRRWIEGTVAVLFAVAGLGLIRSAFSR